MYLFLGALFLREAKAEKFINNPQFLDLTLVVQFIQECLIKCYVHFKVLLENMLKSIRNSSFTMPSFQYIKMFQVI